MKIVTKEGDLIHHRNPSGMHNKVKYILSECKYNQARYDNLYKNIIKTASWENALVIAQLIIYRNFNTLKERYPQYWRWAKVFVNKEREWRIKQNDKNI